MCHLWHKHFSVSLRYLSSSLFSRWLGGHAPQKVQEKDAGTSVCLAHGWPCEAELSANWPRCIVNKKSTFSLLSEGDFKVNLLLQHYLWFNRQANLEMESINGHLGYSPGLQDKWKYLLSKRIAAAQQKNFHFWLGLFWIKRTETQLKLLQVNGDMLVC